MSDQSRTVVIPRTTIGLILRVVAFGLLALWLTGLLARMAFPWPWLAVDLWMLGALLG